MTIPDAQYFTGLRRASFLIGAIIFASLACNRLGAAEPAIGWNTPAASHITLGAQENDVLRITSSGGAFTLESTQSLPAKTGDSFEVAVGIKVDISTRALPNWCAMTAAGARFAFLRHLPRQPMRYDGMAELSAGVCRPTRYGHGACPHRGTGKDELLVRGFEVIQRTPPTTPVAGSIIISAFNARPESKAGFKGTPEKRPVW